MMKRVVKVQSSEFSKIAGDALSSSAGTNFRELDDVFLMTQTKIWLGEVLHIRFDDETNIADLLADGELLFQVSKAVWRMLLKQNVELKHSKVHIYERTSSGKIDGRYTPYPKVDSFLKICLILGLKGVDLFTPSDVVEKRDIRRVCMCIRSFSKKAMSKHLNVPDFDICTYTIAMPTDLVGGIRRYLEQSQDKYVSSNGCSSLSNKTKELHQQKSLGRLSIIHYDSYYESDGAESILIDSELQSPLSSASYDDACLSLINGAVSPRENYNVDRYALQCLDTYDKIESANEGESENCSPLELAIPHEVEEEYHKQFWLTMGGKCHENDLPISSFSDIAIVLDHLDTEFDNELKTSNLSQEIDHKLVDDSVKTNYLEYPNKDSVLDFDELTQEEKFNEANEVDLFKEDKTNSSFDTFKMDSSNCVIDEFIKEYCHSHKHTLEISANDANLSYGFSNSDPKQVENMHTQIEVNKGNVKIDQDLSLSSSEYMINSQAVCDKKENHHEAAIHVKNPITRPVSDVINLCEENALCIYEKYSFNIESDDSELYGKKILEKDVFPDNHPTKPCNFSALNSYSNSLDNDKMSHSQLASLSVPFDAQSIISNCSIREPELCIIEDCYSLPNEIQSETDKDSEQLNSSMTPLVYEFNKRNDLSNEESKDTDNENMHIIKGHTVENGLQKIEGLQENPEENFTKKLSKKTDIEDVSEMRGKEAEDYGKELAPNLQSTRAKQHKVMKSIAGAMTLFGAFFFVHRVRQKKEKEKGSKSTMLLGEGRSVKKLAEIGKKTNENSAKKIYLGERLKF